MSAIETTNSNCYDKCLGEFIDNFPKLSKYSKNIEKYSIAIALICLIIASIFTGAINPQIVESLDYNFNQLLYIGIFYGIALLSAVTACFFSCVAEKKLEKNV